EALRRAYARRLPGGERRRRRRPRPAPQVYRTSCPVSSAGTTASPLHLRSLYELEHGCDEERASALDERWGEPGAGRWKELRLLFPPGLGRRGKDPPVENPGSVVCYRPRRC